VGGGSKVGRGGRRSFALFLVEGVYVCVPSIVNTKNKRDPECLDTQKNAVLNAGIPESAHIVPSSFFLLLVVID
jgi:hypothetical protein